jgi:hypothetical protein
MSAIIVCPKCQHTMQETKENCVVCRKCLFRCHVEYVNGWDAALKQGAQKPSTNTASTPYCNKETCSHYAGNKCHLLSVCGDKFEIRRT